MTTLLLFHLSGAVCLFLFAVAINLTPGLPWRPVVERCAGYALVWEFVAIAFLTSTLRKYQDKTHETRIL